MGRGMMTSFTPAWQSESAAKAAYVAYNEQVPATAPPDRLVEWHPGDGWDRSVTRSGWVHLIVPSRT